MSFERAIDEAFGRFVVAPLVKVLFWDIAFWDPDVQVPIVLLWLVAGAVFFTVRMRLINVRGFAHALAVTAGRYDDPADPGEVSHFQALTSAVSATVGLGNIAGVAIAVSTGGPGAALWMIVAGLLGMSSKFVEVTLAQQYRHIRPDGTVMGGAMYYLPEGLRRLGVPRLGRGLGLLFAVLCVGGSLAGGNSFQVSQSLGMLQEVVPLLRDWPWLYGLVMTVLVGLVIFGGIRRIAAAASKIVPVMGGLYVLMCAVILALRWELLPAAISAIVEGAFTPGAAFGGLIGVMVTGFQRAAFSNEAGIGSAPIAHAAAKTRYPVREGVVALLEPFIDTVIICTMTALVVVLTGAWSDPVNASLVTANKGAALTGVAMQQVLPWAPWLLSVAVVLFAYSTMISWSYYGERCWTWLFGDAASVWYRVLFLVFVFLGSIVTATNVLVFGDLMILAMAFPNVLGVALLSGGVKQALDAYWAQLRAGRFRRDEAR